MKENRSSGWYRGLTATTFSFLATLLYSLPVHAVDAWRIDEIFTNSDGTLQYVKLTTTSNNQQGLAGRSLRALDANGAVGQSYTFPGNLGNSQTANRSVLIGTSALTASVSVDYTLPNGFLFTEGGTVQLVDIHSLAYQRTALPRNGFQALRADGTAVTAAPRNFAGQTSSLSASVISPFNFSNLVLTLPVVDVLGNAVAHASLTLTRDNPLEFTLTDAYIYDSSVTAGTKAARLQSTGVMHVPAVLLGTQLIELNMSLIGDAPIKFGNLAVLSVTDVTPPTNPDNPNEPPQQDPQLTASIARGETRYGDMCALCHGAGGDGGLGPSLRGYSAAAFESLKAIIHGTMPQGNPSACMDNANSTCATDVSNYIIHGLVGSEPSIGY